MRASRWQHALVLGLLVVAAEAAAARRFLPAVAKGQGKNGTQFESSVWITNLSSQAVYFDLRLLPRSDTAAASTRRWIAGGETLTIADLLEDAFARTAGAGTLEVSASRPFALRGSTANLGDKAGRFGADLPALGDADLLRVGETGHALLGSDDGARTNIGLTFSGRDGEARIRVRNASGGLLAERLVTGPTDSAWQEPWPVTGVALARVEIEVRRGAVLAWLAVVDDRTGDAVVEAFRRAPFLPADLLVPGVARADGLAGTRWTTRLRLANVAARATTATLAFADREPLAFEVAPRALLELDGASFLPDGAKGALRVNASGPLLVSAKIVNLAAEGRRYSSILPAIAHGSETATAGRRANLPGVAVSDGRRTNLGLAATEVGFAGELVLHDRLGRERGRAAVALAADEFRQRALGDWFPDASLATAARVELVATAGSAATYAAVIEAGSGDPSLVLPASGPVANDSLAGKLLAGYQGWFGAPGDGAVDAGWKHWFRGSRPVAAELTVDLWPDMTELDDDERFATALTLADGSWAPVFSSHPEKTVARHVRWMADHDLDGAFAQRFVIELDSEAGKAFRDRVLDSLRAAAEGEGRVLALMYDVSRYRGRGFVDAIVRDWEDLTGRQLLARSPAYLHHQGRPVLAIWGIGFDDRPGDPADYLALIARLRASPTAPYLLGGVPADWRTNAEWREVFLALDAVSPWQVGRMYDERTADAFARDVLTPDLAEAKAHGLLYLPVVFPGFSWSHLTGATLNEIPRRGGRFFERQIENAVTRGATALYVAMFDEVDEGTAIFELASRWQLPIGANLLGIDADGEELPSDWYLWLTGQGGRRLRGAAYRGVP